MHHGEKQLDANGEISEERQRPMQHLGEQRPRCERFHQGECRNQEMTETGNDITGNKKAHPHG